MKERNEEKITKQKNSRFWNQHRNFWKLFALVAFAGLFWACGATIWTAVGIYLGYRVLRLVLRLIRQIFSLLFTVISISIMLLIISLLIF